VCAAPILFLLSMIISIAEGAVMQYTVVMLPARVAAALTEFASNTAEGESTFASKDLIIGKDGAGRHAFGLTQSRPDPAMPQQRRYLYFVDNEGALKAMVNEPSVMAAEQVVDGSVVRAVLVALAARRDSGAKDPLATIGWRVIDDTVTVMFVPERADQDGPIIGGATSLGREVHYLVSRAERKVLRTTFAR
jgi:hypothetical protein